MTKIQLKGRQIAIIIPLTAVREQMHLRQHLLHLCPNATSCFMITVIFIVLSRIALTEKLRFKQTLLALFVRFMKSNQLYMHVGILPPSDIWMN